MVAVGGLIGRRGALLAPEGLAVVRLGSRRDGRGAVRSPWGSASLKILRISLRTLRLVYALTVQPLATVAVSSVRQWFPGLWPTWLPGARRCPRRTASGCHVPRASARYLRGKRSQGVKFISR